MSGPEGVEKIQLKYELVENTIRRFLVTWQKINWIGFSRRCKFWLVVFLWSNIWRRERTDDSVIIRTIKSTLLPIVMNWWTSVDTVEEEVYTHIGHCGCRACLKYWRLASSRGQYCLSGSDLICYYTNTWLPAKPIISVFIIYSNWRGTYFVIISCLQDSWCMNE